MHSARREARHTPRAEGSAASTQTIIIYITNNVQSKPSLRYVFGRFPASFSRETGSITVSCVSNSVSQYSTTLRGSSTSPSLRATMGPSAILLNGLASCPQTVAVVLLSIPGLHCRPKLMHYWRVPFPLLVHPRNMSKTREQSCLLRDSYSDQLMGPCQDVPVDPLRTPYRQFRGTRTTAVRFSSPLRIAQ